MPQPRLQSDVSGLVRRTVLGLLAVAFVLVIHRRFWTDWSDPHRCNALLNNGKWLGPPRFRSQEPFRTWQPSGCLLHDYSGKDIQRCVGENRIVAVGDASVRRLFWAIAKKLDKDDALRDMATAAKEGDIYFKSRSTGVDLQFFWDPYLNGTRLFNEVQLHSENNPQMTETETTQVETPATIILVGGGMWYARQYEVGAARRFTSAVNSILLQSGKPNSRPPRLSAPSESEGMGAQIFFIPVEQPFYQLLSPSRQLTIRPEEIDEMNGYLGRLPSDSLTIPWAFSTMLYRRRRLAFEESGLHVIDPIINARANILLNVRCNAKLDGIIGAPFERTCCGNYQTPSLIQSLILLSVLIGLILLGVWTFGGDPGLPNSPLKPFAAIGVALAYCFIADRSQLFNKAHILFNVKDSLWLAGFPLLLGLSSIRKSKATKKLGLPGAIESSDPGFLSRDQTNEIKGWMQAVLLLYHWTGASSQLWLYQIVRIIIASYLFLTGYGHTTYLLSDADYSFQRVTGVLIRLNLLACTLSYVMGTSYAIYYFAPLISFWFMVVFVTMRVRHDKNDSLPFLVVKIVASGLIITLFYAIPILIETLFGLLKVTYGVAWNPADWQFKISTDPYIVFFGMLVAALHQFLIQEPPPDSQRFRLVHALFWRYCSQLKLAATVAAAVILTGYCLLVRRSHSEPDYLRWMPGTSWLPIISFLVLRNSCPLLRRHYSVAFAWLGQMSLETFILQFHILLAADTKGTLSLGVFGGDGTLRHDRWRDLAFLLPFFFWLSWQVMAATRSLAMSFTQQETGTEPAILPSNHGALDWASSRKAAVEEKSSGRVGRLREKLPMGDMRMRVAIIFGVLWCLNRLS